MKTFLRKNLMIVVSVALPLLVVLFFTLASVLPNLLGQPPAHNFLLTDRSRQITVQGPVTLALTVQKGRFRARVIMVKEYESRYISRLFLYDHVTSAVREINLPTPDEIAEFPIGAEIPIPELADLRVSSALEAPDGYVYQGYARGGGGLMTVLFNSNRNRHEVTIAKGGAITRVRIPTSVYWYDQTQFLGWIVD